MQHVPGTEEMIEVRHAQRLLDDIQASIASNWSVSDLEEACRSLLHTWNDVLREEQRDDDIVAQAVDLAVAGFSPEGPNDVDAVRRFCGTTMLLSFISMSSPLTEGSFKAISAATHTGIDILSDYELSIAFCSKLRSMADRNGDSRIATLVTGDMGIAMSRAGRFREALSPLDDALRLSLQQADYSSAARYTSEMARSYFELGDETTAASTWRKALGYAQRCQDRELEAQILTNMRTLSSLYN
jgi:tetratricopeptide (TPR) repeat protein